MDYPLETLFTNSLYVVSVTSSFPLIEIGPRSSFRCVGNPYEFRYDDLCVSLRNQKSTYICRSKNGYTELNRIFLWCESGGGLPRQRPVPMVNRRRLYMSLP